MSGVVVGVDGSDGSRVALRWAAEAAVSLDEPVTVVQSWVYPSGTALPWSAPSLPPAEQLDEATDAALVEVVADELGPQPGPVVHRRVVRGPGARALLSVADQLRPRLLVVGTRGLGGFKGLLLGSVSHQLVEYAPCPVAVIAPERAEAAPSTGLGTIVVGVDGSPGAGDAASWALAAARDAGARLVVVHAFEPTQTELDPSVLDRLRDETEERFRTEWVAPVAASDVDYECVFVDGEPRGALCRIAEEVSADLLVAGALGATELKSMLGSVAAHLTYHAPVPLVIVPRGRSATGGMVAN